MDKLLIFTLLFTLWHVKTQDTVRKVGGLQEVFAWKQITFNINGHMVLEDRFGDDLADSNDNETSRQKRQSSQRSSNVFFNNDDEEPRRGWNPGSRPNNDRNRNRFPTSTSTTTTSRPTTTSAPDDPNQFFIQYNNLPMGVERVGDRLFVTLPRRRYGIPSTLNYLDLNQDSSQRSPGLRPYPNLRESRALTSVYRTRADECNRLWMVDTGLLEIPDNRQQLRPPAIVVYDLQTNRQLFRYNLKSTDLISDVTPTGLASITVDITNRDCADAYAYIPDLATYGLIVFSLRNNDSWRLSHNYFHFEPTAGNMNIAGLRFQWSDGIFSLTLSQATTTGCKTAYFHSMVGTNEYQVSTCVLKNRTASEDGDYWSLYSVVGNRGQNSQSTMHGLHAPTQVVFFGNIAQSAVTCWNTGTVLNPTNVQILASDTVKLSYPSDLHVTGDEVWVMANNLPRWAYSRLDTSEYNFFIYKANVHALITGTVCDGLSTTGYATQSG